MPGKNGIVHGSFLVFVVLSSFVDTRTVYGQESSPKDVEPFLYGGVSSVDRLSKNLESLTKIIDPQNIVKQVLAAIPESLDRTRPIGVFGFWGLVENPTGEQSLEPALLIPTAAPQALLTQLRNMQLIGRPELKDGIWKFQTAIFSCAAVERKGWLVVVANQEIDFAKIPLDLERSLLPFQEQYDLFVALKPKGFPASLGTMIQEEANRRWSGTSPFSDESITKTEAETLFEKELVGRLQDWGKDTSQCTLGLKLPDSKGKLLLEFNATFEPDSLVAREFSQMTEVPSLFSKFGIDEESGRSSWKIQLPKFIADFAIARFKEEAKQLKESFVNSGRDLGFSTESKQLIFDEASQMLVSTLETGNIDSLWLFGRNQMETISMVRAVETNRIDRILMELKKTFEIRPESGQVELNVAKHKGVTMHLVVLKMGQVKEKSNVNSSVLPDEIQIAIGVSKEVLMFATGESPVSALRKALDNTQKAAFGKKNNDAIFATELSVSQFLSDLSSPLVASKESSKLKTKDIKTSDKLNAEFRTVSNGLVGQIAIELGAIDWFVNRMPQVSQNRIASAADKRTPRETKSSNSKTPAPRSNREPSSTTSKAKLDRNKEMEEALAQNKFPEVAKFTDLPWGVQGMDFSPDGQFLAGVKMDDAVVMLSLRNKTKASSKEKLNKLGPMQACAFSPDGKTLVVGGFRGLAQVFSVGNNGALKETTLFSGHSREIKCLSISEDGKYVLSGDSAQKVFCWDISSGDVIAIITGLDGPVKALHMQSKARIAFATDGAKLIQFDLAKKKVVSERKLTDSWSNSQAAAFSANGEYVAVGDSHDIRLWNLKSGDELPRLMQKEIPWSMQFSPDGGTLISGGNGKVNVWDVSQSKLMDVQTLSRFANIQSLAISRDGKQFAVPIENGVQVFQLK